MTHALRRALSATRLLVACGSLGDRDLGDDEGSLSGLHSRDRRKRRTHLRLEARARRGAAALMPAPARAFVRRCVAPVRAFRNRYNSSPPDHRSATPLLHALSGRSDGAACPAPRGAGLLTELDGANETRKRTRKDHRADDMGFHGTLASPPAMRRAREGPRGERSRP